MYGGTGNAGSGPTAVSLMGSGVRAPRTAVGVKAWKELEAAPRMIEASNDNLKFKGTTKNKEHFFLVFMAVRT